VSTRDPTSSAGPPDEGTRGFATRAVHGGERQPAPPRGPVTVPIHQTAPFRFASADDLDRAFRHHEETGEGETTLYSRYGNPSVRVVEEKLARLEGAEEAVAFSSGMAAISGLLSTLLTSGDRLLAAGEIYGGTHGWLGWLGRHHPEVGVERVPLSELADRLEAGVAEETRVVYLETPSNPLLVCCDLVRVAELCRQRDLILVVDNTFATPVLQNPLELGAQLVVHSATKFLAGHSDVVAGAVAGDRDTLLAVRETLRVGGACLDPHAAFLVARGMRTLALRVERQSHNAHRLASFLRDHPRVARVFYPGFDPVARRQMRAGGGMVTFELKAPREPAGSTAAAAAKLVDALEIVGIIPSLGGVETGIMIPALSSHRQLSRRERVEAGISDGLLRLSCGIEDAEDLEEDLAQALARAFGA